MFLKAKCLKSKNSFDKGKKIWFTLYCEAIKTFVEIPEIVQYD